jgi:hypothetical protein
MTIDDGTAIVLAYVLVSMGVIIAFLLAAFVIGWSSAAPAPPTILAITTPNLAHLDIFASACRPAVLGGLGEFEQELIRARTGEGCKRAKERGVRFGRPPKLNARSRVSYVR